MFRFKRLVFGVNCAPEIFQRVMENILREIESAIVYIDDILIYAKGIEELKTTTEKVLQTLKNNNLTLNDEKCEYEKEKLKFLGHTVSSAGLNIDEEKVKDLLAFRKPKSASETKSFLGIVSYNSGYIAHFSDLTAPLWKVANAKVFTWGEVEDKAFEDVKQAIADCTIAQGFFSMTDKTELFTDASPSALGAVLTQINEAGEKRIISFASKALTETEKRYAQTQREALAIVWACEHFYYYLLGQKFTIKTDAQGISYIFNRDANAPKRLLRRAEGWAMRLDSFDYEIEFIKGSDNISDPSSRLFVGECTEYMEGEAPCEISTISAEIADDANFSENFMPLLEVAMHTKHDEELQAVIRALENGTWESIAKPYENLEQELRFDKGVVTRDGRVVIPQTLRMKALTLAHKGHPGMTKMKSILRERVWWRLMGKHTEQWVSECRACELNSRGERPVPMTRTRLPEAPWDLIAVDFCGPYAMFGGISVLGIVDFYSRMMLAGIVQSTDGDATMTYLGETFDLLGFPEALKSDHGPPYNSRAFEQFCEERGIEHIFSWPLTPQQNGLAEKAMATIGKAMTMAALEGGDYRKALSEAVRAHNTAVHRTTNQVPSDVMFGRRLRRNLPLARDAVVTIDVEEMRERDRDEKQKAKEREDRKRGAREHSLEPGDKVVTKRANKRKGESNFDPTELEVVATRRGDITMRRPDGSEMKRNITMVKKLRGNDGMTVQTAPSMDAQRPKRCVGKPQRYLNVVDHEAEM
jgi:transposase InsO family protein